MNPASLCGKCARALNRRKLATWALLAAFVIAPATALAGKLETWRQDTAAAFAKGHKERIVVSDAGRIRLGREIQPTEAIDAGQVWALARSKGAVYAATGNAGKVFRREGNGPWSVEYDSDDALALSLATLGDGRVFVGTGPSGQVVEVTDPKHPASRPDPSVQYIWSLTSDAQGNLYAATGPTGQLWKRSADGKWSLLLDSKYSHLLCVVIGHDGAVYTGSDGEGLIYRVAPDGKVSVVYDAPQHEVRSLLIAPDGALFAGTAAEAGGGSGGGPTRGIASVSSADEPPSAPGGPVRVAAAPQTKGQNRPPEAPPGGTAAPRPVTPGDNAVYRIGSDGAAREIFRARALIYALAWQGDRLLVGTGPEGQLYEVRELGRESAPVARLDHGQVLSLLADSEGDLLIGATDPGAVLRLAAGYAASGSLTSDVHDAKLISRFGAVNWSADRPTGTSIAVQVRTGNVGDPDPTWSSWSPAITTPGARAQVPPGRFVQYRVSLKSETREATPELRSVALLYQTVNLGPEIARIDVPDASDGDGSARPPRLTLKWEANDPNGDDLTYTLRIRKEGWPDWVRLGDNPITERSFAWDTTSVPAGVYRLRVTASDRLGNPPDEALERELTSEAFLIDHEAPKVSVTPKGKGATVVLKDQYTRLVRAAYALDGGDWVPIFPADGLFDSMEETIAISLPDLKPGTHVLMVRATDAAGNVAGGDAVLSIP
jgi:hypothetical protein